eukprot:9836577-Alexandrium_andersonii.AAC.1
MSSASSRRRSRSGAAAAPGRRALGPKTLSTALPRPRSRAAGRDVEAKPMPRWSGGGGGKVSEGGALLPARL